MSTTIVCQACGQRLDIPADHARRKMQCPVCGVLNELPTQAAEQGPVPSRSKQSSPADNPKPPPVRQARAKKPPPAQSGLQALRQDHRQSGTAPNPSLAPAAVSRSEVASPTQPRAPAEEDEDDGKPYTLIGGVVRKCPNCRRELAPDAVLCLACGYNSQSGDKAPAMKYDRRQHHWESGLSFSARRTSFLAAQVILILLGLVGAWQLDSMVAFVAPWLTFTAFLAFLLGTYERLDVERSERGRIKILKTLHIFFFLRREQPISLRDYEGIVTGTADDRGFSDWLVLFSLLPLIVPPILWSWFVLCGDTYFVALSKYHGSPELMLYRGYNEGVMKEIAETLRDIAGLPYGLH